MKKSYVISLDIGTTSVGYAAITEDNKVISKRFRIRGNTDKKTIKKNILGASLFEEAEVAEGRRICRTTGRRYTRRRNRIHYLQEIFSSEMDQVDENFFHRLDESFYVEKDKQYSKYTIFGTLQEEKDYHKTYPTIYHLREALANSKEKFDLRLIYLAIAHMLKYRGHFLYENLDISADKLENLFDLKNLFEKFLEEYNKVEETELLYQDDIANILKASLSRKERSDSILKLFAGEKRTGRFYQLLSLIVGNSANFKKSFGLSEDLKLQFSKDTFEADFEELLGKFGDQYSELILSAKEVYSAMTLSDIVKGAEYETLAPLSTSMVSRYEQHKKDLSKLKAFFIQHFNQEQYSEMFKDESKNGYTGYISGSTSQENFYAYLKNVLNKEREAATYFIDKIEKADFLRKQRTFDNGAIPHQIHLLELDAILTSQSKYYPFLFEQKEKIKKILTFRIPFYVGPLARDNSKWAWLTRKSDEKIRPWNFDEIVDKEKSAEDFINKMTVMDIYLPQEKVLPRHSMLYEEYTIFNELTKVKYEDERGKKFYFDAEMKQNIFEELFKKRRKVRAKDLLIYLDEEYPYLRIKELHGVKKSFNSSYATYHDLKKIISPELLDNTENSHKFEEIIKILTIFEDKEMIQSRLSEYSNMFSKAELKKLSRRHYTGWGKLSAKLINGIRNKENNQTILDYLKGDTGNNRNFMQLIHDDSLSFKDEILKSQIIGEEGTLDSIVQAVPGSPKIKRGILQSIKIVDEIVEIMGYKPSRIIIEMARENQYTSNTKKRLKHLEECIKDLGSDILKVYPIKNNNQLQSKKLYLYYLQNGKDMYTGEELDIEYLSDYDIDHIIPQSFIKDDSIDNLVLTKQEKNRGKSNNVPSQDVVYKMRPMWDRLLKSNLISQRKYNNLTKSVRSKSGGVTEEDKERFINRQLVETRQITKHVAQILDERYNEKDKVDEKGKRIRDVKIVTLKSYFVSQFRKAFEIYKVRDVNHYHHAHDAYLNAVVGQALLKMYPQFEADFVYGEFKRFNRNMENKATYKKLLYSNLMKFFTKDEHFVNEDGESVWYKKRDIKIIKAVIENSQVNIVKKTEIQDGAFTKETPLSKGKTNKLLPLKTKEVYLDPEKYGGYSSPTISYAVLVVAEAERGRSKKFKLVKELVGITIMERASFEKDKIAFLEKKGYRNIQKDKLITLPKYSLFEFPDGYRRLLVSVIVGEVGKGKGELQKGDEMRLPAHLVTLLYHAQHVEKSVDEPEHKKYVEKHQDEFQELFDFVLKFSQKKIIKSKVEQLLRDTFNNSKDSSIEDLSKAFLSLMKYTAFGASTTFKFFEKEIDRNSFRYRSSISGCLNAVLIYQSVTGLYETRIDLGEL